MFGDACRLARGAGIPGVCDWCAARLEGGQRRWCHRECATAFWDQHIWTRARICVLVRDGGRCVVCGDDDRVEVDHIVPRKGRGYARGCSHHHDNLQTLCHAHHVEKTTADQARPGTVTQLTLVAA